MSSPCLIDRHGRVHTSLRVSVTDRCNIRCIYCMPGELVEFRPREELLTFEEIRRFVCVAAAAGVTKIRLTGGEPLLRTNLAQLIRMLADIPGLNDVALTTNGMLLDRQAKDLRRAGLRRINISLDTLKEERFRVIARRPGLDQVLRGIAAAIAAGFAQIRLNAIAMRGITEEEVDPLVAFARRHRLELRFIEYMPLDADHSWSAADVLSGEEIRDRIESRFGPLQPLPSGDRSQPSTDFRFDDGGGTVGFINSVTEPFCSTCNRLRLTAEGQVRNCLFSVEEWDARSIIRGGGSDDAIRDLLLNCVAAKKAGHGIETPEFVRPQRAMYQIGG